MDRLKGFSTALIIILMSGFFIWALVPKEDFSKKISKDIKNDQKKADVVFKQATLAEIYDGVKYWELLAQQSVVNKSTGLANMNDVDGLFFDKGRPTIKFLAPTAAWNIDKNEILLTDPIGYDVKNEKLVKEELAKVKDVTKLYSIFHLPMRKGNLFEGYWFSARSLNWKLSTKKLICVGAISLTKGDIIINAEKLEADVGLEKVVLTGHPSAEIFREGESVSTTADRFTVDSSTDTVYEDNNVTIFGNGSKITTSRTVYDQKNGIINLYGGVYLNDNRITAFSNSATYDVKNKKVTLKEKAKAKRDGNEVYGDKLSVYLGQNKIVLEGKAKARIQGVELK